MSCGWWLMSLALAAAPRAVELIELWDWAWNFEAWVKSATLNLQMLINTLKSCMQIFRTSPRSEFCYEKAPHSQSWNWNLTPGKWLTFLSSMSPARSYFVGLSKDGCLGESWQPRCGCHLESKSAKEVSLESSWVILGQQVAHGRITRKTWKFRKFFKGL